MNSANLGPYGDAINKELIPEIERRFRGIGAGWARFTYGGSTGGWEALATQVFYPDMYNGAFAACPDPIDFRAYTIINLYEDNNAYTLQGEASRSSVPAIRNYLGEVFATQRDANYMELAQGDRSRSGGQYDIWQAVFGPGRQPTAIRKPIFDKVTGDHRPRGGRLLARALRSVAHHRARLDDTGAASCRARSTSMWAAATTTTSPTRCISRRSVSRRCEPQYERRASPTATAPSIAGTAIRSCPTPTRACITTFSTCRIILKRIAASAPAGADLTQLALLGRSRGGSPGAIARGVSGVS